MSQASSAGSGAGSGGPGSNAGGKKTVGELLVIERKVSVTQLAEAREEQKKNGGRLTSALVRLGHMNDKELADFLGSQYSVPAVDLEHFEIDESALSTLTREICEKHLVIPVSRAGDTLVVAFSDPSNLFVRDDLRFITKCKIEVVVAAENAIQKAIERYYRRGQDLGRLVDEMENSDEALNFTQSLEALALDKDSESGPIVKFVNLMLAESIKLKASDIHIEPYEKRFRVRFRIDGLLHEKIQPPPGVAAGLVSRLKIMSRLDIAERRKPQDGRLKVKTMSRQEVDFRVSVLPTLFGEKVVMRLLDKGNLKLDMTKLGFEDDDLLVFREKISEPQGMILITGPTGSGKTVTLYSALQSLNDPQVNISTAEDPVEFNLDGINQVQVNPDIGFDFADALRSFLRQDPDVILVGEIRDLVTAEVAFKAASTGHLVLSTLHTNDAPATVSRLLDMGIVPYVITSTVSVVVAQRLVGRVCERCKEPHKVEKAALIRAGVPEAEADQYEPVRGTGCANCNGSGVKGRVALFEVMTITDVLREAILSGAGPVEIKRAALRGGMRSLRQAGLMKLKKGEISFEQLLTMTVGDGQVTN
ncbi:MAG: type IV-A pilus assembly ATPase PilB [Bdellovibrionales bacterium]|jgi:type IV pilus assembly protein PilB|nr:type IV-A pilus assembly ATPase PilB [Bdellovibrionales bacterium]